MTARKPKRARGLGISDERYEAMLRAQGGRCAIPGCVRTPKTRRFHVDHDHRTGQVRELLCHWHNRMLPVGVTAAELLALAEYLLKHDPPPEVS